MASSAQQDITLFPVPDPDLEIRVDPVSKNFFSALRAQFGLKIRGGWGGEALQAVNQTGPLWQSD